MPNLLIERSIDIEEIVRSALSVYFIAYTLPLPEKFETPSLLIRKVGGTEANKIDTFDLTIDARANLEADADELLRNAIGALKEIARLQTTAIRFVEVNSSGSWGQDPVRPDLAMCTARIRVTAHQELTTIARRKKI